MPQAVPPVIYFYKARDPYGCFSNFSPHAIHLQGQDWPTVEHFYQTQKFAGTDEREAIAKIRAALSPEEAARLGRDSRRRVRPDWESVKRPVMYAAVWAKFSTHADIRQVLLSTGDALLVEASPTDYYWGCGEDGSGANHLGKILMQVRDRLRQPDARS